MLPIKRYLEENLSGLTDFRMTKLPNLAGNDKKWVIFSLDYSTL